VELKSTGDNLYKSIFSRNIGFLTESEQDKLLNSRVAISGLGGVGGLLAERLIRLGIGKIVFSDPETFEESNINRQFGSSMANLGQNKAEVVFTQLKDINPQAEILYNKVGIKTKEDADTFVRNCDVVVDEMDFGLFRESILLQRACRNSGIYYMFASAIGFGALSVIFDPRGLTLEEYNGFPPDLDVEKTEELTVPLGKVVPVLPSYVSSIPADIIQKIMAKEIPGPTTSIGAGLASILAANEVLNIILKKRNITCAPQFLYTDLLDQKFQIGKIT
jgi:molybdopterin/thiamine biosynthesis adenylyltransferase